MLGCALSHIQTWETIVQDRSTRDPNAIYLIFEDDVVLAADFAPRWERVMESLALDFTWQVLWLGTLDSPDIYGDFWVHEGVKQFTHVPRFYGAGAFAYAVRRKGVESLLASVYRDGVMQAIDWFMFEQFSHFPCYFLDPPLASAPKGQGIDSDNNEEYPQVRLLLQKSQQVGGECVLCIFILTLFLCVSILLLLLTQQNY